MKHVFIVAGDTSGDLHAAHLVKELSHQYDIRFSGIGGQAMQDAGVHLLHDLARTSVTGFTAVIRESRDIFKAYRVGKAFIQQNPIDLLILVDYPGFNLRFAKLAKKKGLKILYYISPQIWAWKANRIHTIRQTVDAMAVILPFEKKLYEKANVKSYFVGHPLGELKPTPEKIPLYQKQFHLPNNKLIALLPGSRKNEIRSFLPIMLRAAEKLKDSHSDISFVLIIAPSLKDELIKPFLENCSLKITCVRGHMREVVNCCHSAIVSSGTASLEVALLNIPMVIIYKATCLTYVIASQVIKTRYLGLANLLLNKMLIPELLQQDLNENTIYDVMNRYLTDETHYQKSRQELKLISKMLENNTADCRLSTLVLNMLMFSTITTKETAISCENSQIEA